MSNVLLSVFTLFVSGLPEADANQVDPGLSVAAVFQNSGDAPVSSLLQRPRWPSEPRPSEPIFRAQSQGGVFETPPIGTPLGAPMGAAQAPYSGYAGTSQFGSDPVLPYLNDPGQTILSGVNGPQPQRLGWTPMFDATYIIPSSTSAPASGRFSVQEYDAALRYVTLLDLDWVFTSTFQGGARVWSGPNTPDMPGSVYRMGWDLLFSSPQVGPWIFQFDFNPSVNSDFQSSLARESVNLDANITGFYRISPQWMLVLGVQYWDRVNDIIIPNAGVVWNPTDRLELRLLFPKSRISYFLGTFGDGAHWLYATGEYHVESYQINMPGVSDREQVQLSDWRFGIGLRSDHQWYDKYVEVGYVIGRDVKYLRTTPGFDISDGFMVRAGVRF